MPRRAGAFVVIERWSDSLIWPIPSVDVEVIRCCPKRDLWAVRAHARLPRLPHPKTIAYCEPWLANHLDGLKQALLEKAIEKDFCSEYDAFAAEWDLLPRHREYHVTVTLTVQATDEDNARDIVENAMNLYYVDTVSDPEFDVREVY